MSGKIPVRIVSDGDGSGTLHRVGVDFGRNHNFEVVTAADQRAGGHVAMTQAVATALGVNSGGSYLLDSYASGDLNAIFSLRRVRTSYGGGATDYIVTVRESSNNWTADVLLDPATQRVTLNSPVANLSGGSGGTLGAWVGANSAWITRDYDHSGNARHATQGTTDRQKRIVNAGVLDTTVPGGSVVGAHCNTTTGLFQGSETATFTVSSTTPEIVTYGYSEAGTDQPANWDHGSSNWFGFGTTPLLDVWASSRPTWSPNLSTTTFLLNVGLWHSARRTDATTMEADWFTTAPDNNARSHTGTTAVIASRFVRWGGSSSGRFIGRGAECFVFGRNLTAGERLALRTNQFAFWV